MAKQAKYWERGRLARIRWAVDGRSEFALSAGEGAAVPVVTALFLKRNRTLWATFKDKEFETGGYCSRVVPWSIPVGMESIPHLLRR